MKSSLDKLWFGALLGLIMPIAFGYLFLISTYSGDFSLDSLFRFMSGNSMIIKFLFVAMLPDMGAVFLLNTLEMWRACRGMFAAIGLFILICGIFLIVNI